MLVYDERGWWFRETRLECLFEAGDCALLEHDAGEEEEDCEDED